MSDHMDRNVLLIKEHIGMFKAANNFDIFDPATGEPLPYCRERSRVSAWTPVAPTSR